MADRGFVIAICWQQEELTLTSATIDRGQVGGVRIHVIGRLKQCHIIPNIDHGRNMTNGISFLSTIIMLTIFQNLLCTD